MRRTLFIFSFLISMLAEAKLSYEKNLAVGYVNFETTCSPEKVQSIAQKFSKDDPHFKIWAVSEIDGENTFGFYFKYELNDKIKNEDDLMALIKQYRKDLKLGKECKDGHNSFSQKVISIAK